MERGPVQILYLLNSPVNVKSTAKEVAGKARKGVFVNQMRSPMVRDRIAKALDYRMEIRELHNDWKMFVNDKVQLMVKKPGEKLYIKYKQF